MQSTSPTLKELLLIGGGHAHVHVIKMLGMQPVEGLRVTLITRDVETPYSGMLPGFVAGLYTREECHIDLVRLCAFANVRLIHAEVIGLNTKKKRVHLSGNRPYFHYDVLSIDIGITPKPFSVEGMDNNTSTYNSFDFVVPVKPIDGFARKWNKTLTNILHSNTVHRTFRAVVVGGGAGGVELTFAIHFRLQQELLKLGRDVSRLEVWIVTKGNRLLPNHSSAVSEKIKEIMDGKGIRVVCNTEITKIVKSNENVNEVTLMSSLSCDEAGAEVVSCDKVFWCVDACAQSWLKDAGLATTPAEGFVLVQPTLESVNVADVFACGDVCHMPEHPRPKAGVFAVRAGPPLLTNLRNRLFGRPLEPWEPQVEFLGIIGTYGTAGDSSNNSYAVASKGPLMLHGSEIWQLKDKIDRQWMLGYSALPDMTKMTKATPTTLGSLVLEEDLQQIIAKSSMRCGGCGSKVGASILSRALRRVRKHMSKNNNTSIEVLSRLGDDDAAVVVAAQLPMLSVHTIDFFRSCHSDPFLFGQISANHALSDVFAMNGDAVSALALCVVPFGPDKQVEDVLVQLLAGALTVLQQEGCQLIGGHSSETSAGGDVAFGLSVNGQVLPQNVLRKGPLLLGHALILTKALGTGTIFASHMRGQTKAAVLEEALESMKQSNRTAARLLREHGCVACTDITGFGLLGHLLEMLKFHEMVGDDKTNGDNSSDDGSSDDDDDDVCKYPKQQQRKMVRLFMDTLPAMSGALAALKNGIMSSLHPQNLRNARAIQNQQQQVSRWGEKFHLLFDPQTSGGLLGCVPHDRAKAAVQALRENGYCASAIIGEVVDCGESGNENEDEGFPEKLIQLI